MDAFGYYTSIPLFFSFIISFDAFDPLKREFVFVYKVSCLPRGCYLYREKNHWLKLFVPSFDFGYSFPFCFVFYLFFNDNFWSFLIVTSLSLIVFFLDEFFWILLLNCCIQEIIDVGNNSKHRKVLQKFPQRRTAIEYINFYTLEIKNDKYLQSWDKCR